MLDPTATLAINAWLINLRAAAGTEFKLLFMTKLDTGSRSGLSDSGMQNH